MKNKVMVAMSGGVDSAAAALLLKSKYDEVIGSTLVLCDNFDAKDAVNTAKQLGIQHFLYDFKAEFKKYVMDSFANSYKIGQTPNPCIVCNEYIKFGVLLEKAKELGCNRLASGHYVNVEYDDKSGRFLLKKAKDISKDQSYMLYRLSQNTLSMCEFPLADLSKEEIRKLCADADLNIAHKKDSQDICFIPDGDYKAFLSENYGFNEECGDFVLTDGKVLGRHKGQFSYTVGQRKGLNISYTSPLYVISKDFSSNRVILGSNDELFKTRIKFRDANFIPFDAPDEDFLCEGKIRYSAHTAPCRIFSEGDGIFTAEFSTPQRAPTPGQSAVFYDGEYLLGGGIITE